MKISVPVCPSDGNKYLINFSTLEKDIFPKSLWGIFDEVEIIEIVLVRAEGKSVSNIRSLAEISSVIWNILQENENAILYFYCDDRHDIFRRRQGLSPQEYRSMLFTSMFNKAVKDSQEGYVNMPIILKAEYGDIFIHLISRSHNIEYAEHLKNFLLNMSK